jgi:hypothetical protein
MGLLHSRKCWSKDKFDKLLQDPENYFKEKAEKE